MADHLLHTTILITRPINQSNNLCQLLEREGAKVVSLPTIEIIEKKSTAFLHAIKHLDDYAIVIFTSTNAVIHSEKTLKLYWPALPADVQFAAIGASTKLALEQQGWECTIYPETNCSSEGLLDLKSFYNINSKNILIITGKNGRDHLAKTLRSRQAQVTEAMCYERKMPKYSDSVIMELEKNDFDFIVCTSNEGLENLTKILDNALFEKFKNTQIIAFSNRIQSLAKSLGFIKKPIITATTSDQSIVAAIFETKGTTMTDDTLKKQAGNSTAKEKSQVDSTTKPKSHYVSEFKQHDGLKPAYLMSLIAIVIAILALIEGAYLAKQAKQFDVVETNHIKQVKEKFADQTQQLAVFSNQLQQLQANNVINEVKIADSETALNNLKQAKFANNTRWMLAEIKYLLTIAQYNLQLIPDPVTALAILEKVEGQLTQINDPRTLSLRQQVINAISALKSLPTIDYAGILMQLNTVSDQLKTLPLLINTSEGSQKTFSSAVETKGWHKYWQESLKALERILIIRHQNTSIAPLISPKEQQFLQENIQLKLSQASWALLQHNQEVYILSLQDAINWIQIYYSPNTPATSNIIATLESLMKVNLQPQLPDLASSIQLTESLLNTKQPSVKGVK